MPEPAIVNFALWPLNSGAAGNPPFEAWQLITYAFLHDPNSWAHILLNMWALFIFGQDVERVLGIKRYAGLYFTSVLTAGLTQLAWPFISWFTERIFHEDKDIVEYEQRAYDAQGGDWNNEVFPPIRDLRAVLARCGKPQP